MKINKRNPTHWIYLIRFAANVTIAVALRPFRRRSPVRKVVLYGHKLNGNLLSLYRALCNGNIPDIEVTFLTLDPSYYKSLSADGFACVLATSGRCISLLSVAGAVISDHGLHALLPMLWFSDLKFFDVWHGIPFKGFNSDDFRLQRRYEETWVASPLLAQMYVERYGFAAEKVKVTGYARTDELVRPQVPVEAIKRRLGLGGPDVGRIVLFAPTWKQDASNRSIFPFGVGEAAFLELLSALAQRTNSTFVLRAHLNSGESVAKAPDRVVFCSHARFPDTEALLLASDILVCDWSSIAFDFLVLGRPTLFLDVEPPFAKGFSLGPEYRFGDIVSGMDALMRALECYLNHPEMYQARFGERCERIRRAVYGDCADGKASARCVERLQLHLRS